MQSTVLRMGQDQTQNQTVSKANLVTYLGLNSLIFDSDFTGFCLVAPPYPIEIGEFWVVWG